ncbi:hypothetical protein H5V45_02780 [Nocardioides sp. KIGAM211]|uniref:Uncharacterized protein n=1 Tax=Nocardioides luti TaxID=2761101 RepID=A0A7X0RDC9_9ACTN|nr:hypothetical protein [Nocardioides luti]MBB6626238.1 hypothetical protein [Nocardioides luti]
MSVDDLLFLLGPASAPVLAPLALVTLLVLGRPRTEVWLASGLFTVVAWTWATYWWCLDKLMVEYVDNRSIHVAMDVAQAGCALASMALVVTAGRAAYAVADARRRASDDVGWFAYAPLGPHDPALGRAVRKVSLEHDPYGGPFWDDEGCLGEDFPDLHDLVGLSSGLYDDMMAWHEDWLEHGSSPSPDWTETHDAQHRELVRRLRTEVHPYISVTPGPA